jgi:hypothetical protein
VDLSALALLAAIRAADAVDNMFVPPEIRARFGVATILRIEGGRIGGRYDDIGVLELERKIAVIGGARAVTAGSEKERPSRLPYR